MGIGILVISFESINAALLPLLSLPSGSSMVSEVIGNRLPADAKIESISTMHTENRFLVYISSAEYKFGDRIAPPILLRSACDISPKVVAIASKLQSHECSMMDDGASRAAELARTAAVAANAARGEREGEMPSYYGGRTHLENVKSNK